MKKVLYILIAAVALLGSCAKTDLGNVDPNITNEDGKVTMALDLKIQGAQLQAVESRAADFAGSSQENVTSIRGYAFLFEEDLSSEDKFSDNSKLLQKVPFKSVEIEGKSIVYITLEEEERGCFIRLMTCMTDAVHTEMDAFVSQQMIDEGLSSAPVTLFKDYKHISVGLDGYYADGAKPNPAQLTTNTAFPLASPGIDMPNGVTQATVDKVNPMIYMVPVASKVDVTSKCNFTLKEVTLLNGALRARMRSTVMAGDGLHSLDELPLPINLGGVVQYGALAASGNTTAANPIYFYPNKGDGPFDSPLDPEEEREDLLSDPISVKNPTYLIVKGKAAGYSVDGYYKLPIRYKFKKNDGTVADHYTYDIVRNNHYSVNIISVDNPGYASFDEAVAGPANDINYDIVIDEGNSSSDDTFQDPRAETIVSHNGFFYLELVGSEIFAQGYGDAGVKGSFGLSLTRNDKIDANYTIPALTITPSAGISVSTTSVSAGFAGSINFTATKSGTITLRCGDMLKEIPVHYAATPHVFGSGATIGGESLGAISFLASDGDETYTKDAGIINSANGGVAENATYKNREFRGKAYPSDMSKGIRKVYLVQASNFDLNTYYDNTSAGAGGNSGTNNIFKTISSTTMKDVYEADINYQSTGKVYQVNSSNRGTLDSKGTMTNWWIGAAPINFTASGQFAAKFTGSISSSFTKDQWSNITEGSVVTLDAGGIGSNQSGTYDSKKTKISSTAGLTLTNIAGQTKTYNFNLNQYAAPYIEGDDVIYVKDDDAYYWTCTTSADCSSSGSGGSNVGKSLGDSPTVYNAHYVSGEQPIGDYVWREAPTTDGYTGGPTGKSYVSDGVAPQASTTWGNNYGYFWGKVNNRYGSKKSGKWQAYFDLRITNDANEEIHFIITYRRDDSSK